MNVWAHSPALNGRAMHFPLTDFKSGATLSSLPLRSGWRPGRGAVPPSRPSRPPPPPSATSSTAAATPWALEQHIEQMANSASELLHSAAENILFKGNGHVNKSIFITFNETQLLFRQPTGYYTVVYSAKEEDDPEEEEEVSEVSAAASSADKQDDDEDAPAAVFFPTNSNAACQDGQKTGGFNTWGFLAMLLAGFNVINLVSKNDNNRRNNNNNNNNDNNDNNLVINEANTMGMIMNPPGMVIIPPVPIGRELRPPPGRGRRASSCPTWSPASRNLSLAVMDMCLGWLRVHVASEAACRQRSLCEANAEASARGSLASVMAEVASIAIAQAVAQKQAEGGFTWPLLRAARTGRSLASCHKRYNCHDETWKNVTSAAEVFWTTAYPKNNIIK